MDKAIEEEIIKKYVISNKQERIIWELNSSKKREGVMGRRFHRPYVFKEVCLRPIEDINEKDIKKIYRSQTVKQRYIIWVWIISDTCRWSGLWKCQ